MSQGNDNAQSMIPSQCQDMTGRARALCVIRLTHPASSMSSTSSRSSLSSRASTASGSLTSNEDMLRTLLRMSTGDATRINVMRQLCGMVTGEFLSSCAQGKAGIQEFNRQLNTWFINLSHALGGFMMDLNRNGGDTSTNYFWSNMPMTGSGSWNSGSSVQGWNWMNETDSSPSWMSSSSSSSSSPWWTSSSSRSSVSSQNAGNRQQEAWAACEDRTGAGKSRCVRDYLQNVNIQESGASSSY
jgi:hypothetical protein